MKRFFLSILQVCLFIIFSECFILIGMWGNIGFQEFKNKIHIRETAAYRIMCVGESTTYEGGEDSYPRQLEIILNQRDVGIHFKVINQGQAGINSKGIVEKLPNWIKQYQPDMVVAMMGLNDGPEVLQSLEEHPQYTGRILMDLIKGMKIWSLWQGAFQDVMTRHQVVKESVGVSYASDESASEIHRGPEATVTHGRKLDPKISSVDVTDPGSLFSVRLREAPPTYRNLYVYALMLEGEKEYAKAEKLFRMLLSGKIAQELRIKMENKLGDMLRLQQKHQELAGHVREKLERNMSDVWVGQWLDEMCHDPVGGHFMYEELSKLIDKTSDELRLYEILGSCLSAHGRNDDARIYLEKADVIREKSSNPNTVKYARQLARIAAGKDIAVVFVQYPLRSIGTLQQGFKDDEMRNKVIWVENKENFASALRREEYNNYFKDRCCGNFGHGTREGNRLLAENIADSILAQIH